MKFYMLSGLDSYASYSGLTSKDDELLANMVAPKESEKFWQVPTLVEYMGDPPRKKPLKKGLFHSSGSQHFYTSVARGKLAEFLEHTGVFRSVNIVGREDEQIFRYWCNKVVDCLDFKNSVIVDYNPKPGMVGVVKKPAFDEARWDGSDIFRIPGDASHVIYCSERFVEACRQQRIKGMTFGIGYFDPDPIEIR